MKKNLSRFSYILVVLLALSVGSCTKTTTVSYTEPVHQVCLATPGDPAHVESFETEVTTNTVRQVFASQNVTYDESKINSVSLASLKATAINGTFDEVERIQVLLRLVGANSDVEIARSVGIQPGDSTVFLVPADVELKTFVTELSILTVKVTTKAPIAAGALCIDFSEGVVKAEINK